MNEGNRKKIKNKKRWKEKEMKLKTQKKIKKL